jgi:hypothetical protein
LALQAKHNNYIPGSNVGDFFYLRLKPITMAEERFQSFKEFYPFYLSEHQNKTSRTLHFIGTFIVLALLGFFIVAQKEARFWIALPLVGYGFAWVGHAFFEKNKPATFKYPLWSLRGDFTLFFDILLGKRGFDATRD